MPHIGPDVVLNDPAFIHESALIFGKVTIGKDVSVWPYAVMRCEALEIVIGEGTNIQDFVMIHFGTNAPTIIGRECSITHHVTLHGCSIGDYTLIGINSTIMDGAKIGANSIVAGHSLVKEGDVFPDNSVIAGCPAKLIKTRDCSGPNRMNAAFYLQIARNYARGIERIDGAHLELANP